MRDSMQGIIYTYEAEEPVFLLLKRIPALMGAWQPVTGHVEVGETLEEALYREVEEETGFRQFLRMQPLRYTQVIKLPKEELFERVYALELPQKLDPVIGSEHEDWRWVGYMDALQLLHWEANKNALRELYGLLAEYTLPL